MNFKKGFTLIELLVVIAVIGILATIVLINLGGARDGAKDARIRSSLSQLRTVAEISASLGNYEDVCEDIVDAAAYGDLSDMGGENVNCFDHADGYCVQVTLNDGTSLCTSGDQIFKNADCGGNHICD